MSRIEACFNALKNNNKKALIPFITAGDPSLNLTVELMHVLTDQIFALAHARLPQLPEHARIGWYTGAAVLAWLSWIAGTAVGAIAGGELTQRWPFINDILPFALPALFLVLIIPRCNNRLWSLTIFLSAITALLLKVLGYPNIAIPLAAMCGAVLFFALKSQRILGGQ